MSAIAAPVRLAGSTLQDRAHICAFFNSSDEAHRILLPFIKEGLELGQKALHTVDPLRREEHTCWLTSAGIDAGAPNRQVEILDWTETHLRNGKFDPQWTLSFWRKAANDAANQGFPLVRFVSQMEWVLDAGISSEELLEYEANANAAWLDEDGPRNPAVCVYDLTKFRGDLVIDIMRTHPIVLVGGVLQENPFFVPPEKFLSELRERRASGTMSSSTAA